MTHEPHSGQSGEMPPHHSPHTAPRDPMDRRVFGNASSDSYLRLAQRVIESSQEGIIITDARTRIEYVNPAFVRMTGYRLDEAVGQAPAMLSSGRHSRHFYRRLWCELKTQGYWRGEIWNRRKSGELYLEVLTISAIRDDSGDVSHYLALFSDITQQRRNEQHVHNLAWYDALTGLPNRRLFEDRLSLAISYARRHSQRLAVVFIDLDRFKQINDSLGHAAGDELLALSGKRLKGIMREGDSLARVGGDKFIALLPEVTGAEEAITISRQMIKVVGLPFDIGGQRIRVGFSLGISLYPDDHSDPETLIQHAETAMYSAKQTGRNSCQLFHANMKLHNDRHLALESALRETLESGEGLNIHYQPLLDRDSGEMRSAEALMRWQHPRLGTVSPVEFIPLAEDSGLIIALGEWLLRTVVAQLHDWLQAGLNPVPVAINLSANQFWQHELLDHIRSELTHRQVPAELLGFELTESTLLDRHQQAATTLEALRALGCRISIDDFGTGYSSLSYLQCLPVTTLKIDRTFIRALTEGNRRGSEAILNAVTGLARGLDLEVVAEGVETREQLDALANFPIDLIQGFLFAHPLDADTFTENWLKPHDPTAPYRSATL